MAEVKCGEILTTHCDTVTDQRYGGGGYRPKLVPITACLTDDIYESIRLRDGSSAWEVGFYYEAAEPEVDKTVKNDQCWTRSKSGRQQQGNPGSWVVAFICCNLYCGWVGGIIQSDGFVRLEPMELPYKHDPLRQHRLGNGQYNRAVLLQ